MCSADVVTSRIHERCSARGLSRFVCSSWLPREKVSVEMVKESEMVFLFGARNPIFSGMRVLRFLPENPHYYYYYFCIYLYYFVFILFLLFHVIGFYFLFYPHILCQCIYIYIYIYIYVSIYRVRCVNCRLNYVEMKITLISHFIRYINQNYMKIS